jgi:hypothetical protein
MQAGKQTGRQAWPAVGRHFASRATSHHMTMAWSMRTHVDRPPPHQDVTPARRSLALEPLKGVVAAPMLKIRGPPLSPAHGKVHECQSGASSKGGLRCAWVVQPSQAAARQRRHSIPRA